MSDILTMTEALIKLGIKSADALLEARVVLGFFWLCLASKTLLHVLGRVNYVSQHALLIDACCKPLHLKVS